MSESIAIVFSTDDNYAPYTSTAIFSLTENCDRLKKYNIFIFYSNLSQTNIQLLSKLRKDNVAINFINITPSMSKYANLFYTLAHYSQETYYRFFIPQYLGKTYDYVVYLDDDLIVNCDIGEILHEIDISKTINGVTNYSTLNVSKRIQSLGLSYQTYINAGVLVINCKRFESQEYFQKALDCLRIHTNLKCADQDVLNIICKDDIGLISPSWNIQWHNLNNLANIEPAIQKLISEIEFPRIIHYTSEKKPWNCTLNDYSKFYLEYSTRNPVYSHFFSKLCLK